MIITAADVLQAAERIRPVARRTPVMTSHSIDERSGARVFLKCENLQRGGAFKIRGASNLIFSIPAEQLKRGVVAFSSGNHAQAVAIAAEHVGTKATIVMPQDAPKSKIEGTRAHGAEIVLYDRFAESREAIGKRIAEETGATLVPPYDDPMIMAGQGTAALELIQEVESLDALVICVGGGGLLSGCATVAKAMRPSIRVFGAEPESANDTFLSMRAGERIEVPNPPTIADGLRSPAPGAFTFPVIQKLVEDILLIGENEIRETMRYLLMRAKILVEPSGAVGAAAALYRKLPAGLSRVGVVLSGGNVDSNVLSGVLDGSC